VSENLTTSAFNAPKQPLFDLFLETTPEYDEFPLSYSQQRLWFLNEWERGNIAYNLSAPILINGPLNISALERALNQIIARHESLRTTFAVRDEQPRQIIAPYLSLRIPVTDLSDLPEDEREAEATRLMSERARQPFDLQIGPLLHASLIKLRPESHALFLMMHHIVSDGWSMSVLFRDLSAVYGAFCKGEDDPLPELKIQYADYAQWQRERVNDELFQQQISYWKEQLAGAPALLNLPTDYARPRLPNYQGHRLPVALPVDLTKALKDLSRRENVTLFMLLLAAWQLLLSRYSGQPDVVVGTPTANRTRAEVEPLIGFFVNNLALRLNVNGQETFRQLLKKARESCFGAYAHQDIPFELVLETIQPERSTSYSPLFQTMFQLQGAAVENLRLPGLQCSRMNVDTGTAKFDLMLSLDNKEDNLSGWLEYNSDIFKQETAARLLNHLETLLTGIVKDPEQKVSTYPLLSQAEEQQLVHGWNDTLTAFPREQCIHQLFEAQVNRTPEAVALVHNEARLSYRELNERANQLANYLRADGVGPESLVGIHIERSIEMVVALLGVLKAGAAYLPLDPGFPISRLQFMLADAGIKTLLSTSDLAKGLPAIHEGTIFLDSDWPVISESSAQDPGPLASPENLAYVIYTSGSTGTPKGVQITHVSLTNFLLSMQDELKLSADDVLAAVTTLSFDIAGLELYVPLITGARLVVLDRKIATDGPALAEELQRIQATVMQATPATWRLLVESGWDGDAGLQILCGGESLGAELAEQLKARSGRLWNVYGPTETTIWSTIYPIETLNGVVLIGKPIWNTQTYILDRQQRLVPAGVTGELYIGGTGLARGYLGRPELTAEKFIPDPFGAEPGARLYRTGDLARHREGGELECLGRVDNQVKVRGFRIELGEIEAALLANAAVSEAVVVAQDDGSGEKRLVAYLVPYESEQLDIAEFRSRLKDRLPDYMVPAWYVLLEKLPLTPNGKVDRKSLPAPETGRSGLTNFVAPRSHVEEILAGLWMQTLNVDQVGIDDNFFDLGGHSLLATRLLSRVRRSLDVELRLDQLFSAPTIAGMAKEVEAAQQAVGKLQAPPIVPVERSEALLLSYPQLRLWFLDQLEPGTTAYNIRMAVRLTGPLNLNAFEQSLTEIIRRHEPLRTNFVAIEGEPRQMIADPPQVFGATIIDLTHLRESEREAEAKRLANIEAQTPFDLSKDLMLRACLIRLNREEEESLLVVTTHHIAGDGWSMGLLFDELSVLYRSFARGEESPLPELPIQYADFAVWQRNWLQSAVLDEQLNYWEQRLAGTSGVLELPTDRPRSALSPLSWGMPFHIEWSPELTKALRDLCRRQDVTLHMLLLAAFQTLLHRYTGQDDICVGTPIANRTRDELEVLIGFFVNTLVMRADFSEAPSFRELLEQTRQRCLEAYMHQDAPFEKIVQRIQPTRSRDLSTLFQVFFQVQNAPMEALTLEGVNLSPVSIEGGMVKLDLAMTIKEAGDRLTANLRYNTELFDHATIAAMSAHLRTLLETIVTDPDQKVSQISLMSPAEEEQLRHRSNPASRSYAREQCVHQLFEEQVQRNPDATAVIDIGERLSYRELNERANQLARYLKAQQVGPESVVGICLERSVEMIVAMLAVLKAGAAYLPLDPAYPESRLNLMLDDARVQFVISQRPLLNSVDMQCDALGEEEGEISDHENCDLRINTAGQNLAYVIYTSGSTGSPKGVLVQHDSLCNFTHATIENYCLTSADRVLQFASFSFDTSIEEIFPALCSGATLVLRNDEMLGPAADFLDHCARLQITVVDLPTAFWHELTAGMRREGLQMPPCVRLVIIGGERAINERALQWQTVRGESRLVNTYGPTEATVVATFCEVDPEHLELQQQVFIGRPLSNTRAYVLNDAFALSPTGTVGELYVGGAGLARGYLGKPDLTAGKFVPDPFSNEPGARLYRTGDLARYRSNGELEYVGRTDNQIKVRGFRVELGEIEAALREHSAVSEALVTAQDDDSGEKRLVAYVVPQEGEQLNPAELRRALKERLPEYMVPAWFIELDKLPLTPNGKVDRRNLPDPAGFQSPARDGYVAPRNPIEEELVGIWEQLLNVTPIGVEDNFFELGGHSLLLTRLASQLRQTFHIELSLRELFMAPTISETMQIIAVKQIDEEDSAALAQMIDELDTVSEDELRALLEVEGKAF
jgi:amino acid adenylation domain-containing protein